MGARLPTLSAFPTRSQAFLESKGRSGLCHKRTLGGAGQKAGMGGAQGTQNEGNSQQLCGVLKGVLSRECGGAQTPKAECE